MLNKTYLDAKVICKFKARYSPMLNNMFNPHLQT